MVANKISAKIILSLVVVLALLAWFVLAVSPVDTVRVVSPTSGTNVKWLNGTLIFEATFLNGSLGLGSNVVAPRFNGSFLFNISGVLIQVANITNGCVQNGTSATFTCTSNVTNLTVAEGNYTLTFNVTNGTNNGAGVNSLMANQSGNFSTSIVIDHTSPIVEIANISVPFSAGGNLSGNYTFNVSVGDAVLGVQTVIINMTNGSNIMVLNRTLVLEGTNRYIASINTSRFSDGYYNITLQANDSLGNLNDSIIVQRIIIDNTVPVMTLTCTPNPVTQDETITCTCSATDATSGLNTTYGINGISTTANPSTALTGPSFSTSCTAKDKSGNSQTVSATYAVDSASSGIGSTGSTTGSTSGSGSTTGSTGSGSNTGLANGSSVGSAGSTNGSGNVLPGNQNPELPETKGMSNAWIIAIIIIVAIVIGIIIMLKRRKI